MKQSDSRAMRRHHAARIKKQRAKYWLGWSKTPKMLGKLVHTSTPCSCFVCGNSRRWLGEVTIAERRQQDRANYEMDELFMEEHEYEEDT